MITRAGAEARAFHQEAQISSVLGKLSSIFFRPIARAERSSHLGSGADIITHTPSWGGGSSVCSSRTEEITVQYSPETGQDGLYNRAETLR